MRRASVVKNKRPDTRRAGPLCFFAEPGATLLPKDFVDGTSHTIMFATRMAYCGDGGSRFEADPTSAWGAFFGAHAASQSAHTTDTASTFLLAPTIAQCVPTPLMAHSFGTVGLQVALGDASVRNIGPGISPESWNRAMQPNDGLQLGADWEQ